MASRRRSSRTHLLILALVAGCTAAPVGTTGTMPAATTTTSTTTPPSITTTEATTTTTANAPSTTVTVELPEIDAEVRVPDGEGPFPAIVLVHGGAWVAGSPAGIRDLATYLTGEGFLTVNPSYRLADDFPGFPFALDDISCAVRYAAAHPDSDGTVAIVGHSAGAHLGAIVALTGDAYGGDCPIDGTGIPNKFVGMAGPYDVLRLGFLVVPFFGVGPVDDPDAWSAGNPQGLTDENTDLQSLIMIGELDGIVDDSFGVNFNGALLDSGSESILEVVEGARHTDLVNPAFVGALIATWLDR
jgi:acetyl esterase/lipase